MRTPASPFRAAHEPSATDAAHAGSLAARPQMKRGRGIAAPRFAGTTRVLEQAWPLADQTLVSAANFVTMVLLARGMSPSAFGSFTLLYSVLLFANTLQSSLITQPHNVLGVSREGPAYRRFTATAGVAQLGIALGAGAVALLVGVVGYAVGWQAAPLMLVLGPSIVAWQLQEFVRRVLYTERRVAAAFVNDLISYAGQGLAIGILWHFADLTPARALWALAATSALGAAYGVVQIRGSFARAYDAAALRETWHFGKWLAGGEILRWLSSVELYQYLAAGILGTAATATLKSAQVIFGPTRLLLFSLNNVLPNQFAHSLRSGVARLHSDLVRVYVLTLVPLAVYCGAVALFAAPILRLLYGPAYAGGARVLSLYAVSSFVAYLALIMSAALKARRMTRSVFNTYLCTSIISVSAGWAFIRLLGVEGALVGMILTSLVASLTFWRAYRRAGVTDVSTQSQ